MNKGKFYAVKKGAKTGIFDTWKECEESIKGYKGAIYKSFSCKNDAELYLKDIDALNHHKGKAKEINGIVAYIDGSYCKESNRYSFGCIIINASGIVKSNYAYGDDAIAASLKNVAGELQGAMYAVKWAIDNKYENILIKHDYEGVSKWITGEWRVKNPATKIYFDFINNCKEKIDIKFEKVVGHGGDKYNEQVDRLAKKALSSGKKINKGASWINVKDITVDDLEIILETLKEEIDVEVIKLEDNIQFKMYKVKLQKEQLVIKMFIEQNSLLIQGKYGKISELLLSYISEFVEVDQMNEIKNDLFKININKDNIEDQFLGYFINLNENIPEKLKKVLYQAVYNLNIEGDMFDASFLIFPALRGLEGFLKLILNKFNINCENGFCMFDIKGNGTYCLLNSYKENIGSPKKISYINKMYNFYHKHRHSLFHWDNPGNSIDTTKLIENCSGAHNIIKSTLQLINEYYTIN